MKRRQLLLGSGVTLGAASILGTGAFTSVSADRDVSVTVADDADAFLRLAPCDSPNGQYVDNEDGLLNINLSGSNSNSDPSGDGVNPHGITRFDDVFEIANQGTQNVCVDFEIDVPQISNDADVPDRYDFGPGDPAVVFYRGSDRERLVVNNRLDPDRDGAIRLPIDNGNAECIGFEVRAFGFDSDEDLFEGEELTIRADADAECTLPEEGGDVADPTPIGPTDGLVGYWPLDDLSDGTTPDIIGENDGQINGNVELASGQVGGAAEFDGDDDYVQISDNQSLGVTNVSISAWIYRVGSKNRVYVFDGRDHNYFVKLDDRTSTPQVGVFDDNGGLHVLNAESGDIPEEEWTHIVGTYDGNELSIYINGENDGTQTAQGSIRVSPGPARIGGYIGGGYGHQGRIGNVRVYGRTLSENEVKDLYDATSGG